MNQVSNFNPLGYRGEEGASYTDILEDVLSQEHGWVAAGFKDTELGV
jgi:hypothetical protein